eukprot:s288_g39.t1
MERFLGLLCALGAAVAFGLQYVPVKKYEIFDGVTFQWFMCGGILMAIEHREGNWSRRRLLLDVGATDADNKAARLTCLLMDLPERKEAHATENVDKIRILNSIALSRLGTCDFELLQSYPSGDPNFQRVDEALASHFALSSWYGFVLQGRCTEVLARAVKADVGRKIVQLSLTGCQNFSDHELDVLVQSLPSELRALRLDLGFSGLETLDMFTSSVQCLKSLVQLKLRFTGSAHFRTAEGLGVALREMESLMYLELWFAAL